MHSRVRNRHEDGQVMVIFALVLTALIGMVGLAIDGGFMYADRRSMQNAADAAALAAARYLAQSWNGATLAANDAHAYSVALHFAQANGLIAAGGGIHLDYLDQHGAVVANHPASLPVLVTRGVRVVATAKRPASFSRILGTQFLRPSAQATAMFGPPGSGLGVTPISVDDSLQGDTSRLQPAGGGGGGSYVNASILNTAAFGSHQSLADALLQGVHDPLTLGRSYPTSAPDNAVWRRDPVVYALQDRINRGQARGDTYTHFTADSPQLLIVPTVVGGFPDAPSPVTLYSFRAFFVVAVDTNRDGANWIKGYFVSAPLAAGTIDYAAPYEGVTITKLVK